MKSICFYQDIETGQSAGWNIIDPDDHMQRAFRPFSGETKSLEIEIPGFLDPAELDPDQLEGFLSFIGDVWRRGIEAGLDHYEEGTNDR